MADADIFAGKGSMAARLKARREAIDAGQPEMAAEAYSRGEWKDLSVDNTVGNGKITEENPDTKPHLR